MATKQVKNDPASGATAANHSDTVALTNGPCRALYVGTTGDVKVTMLNGDVVTFTAVPVGILPVACTQVWSTGTGASNIVVLY